jgi:exosortase H (IPTLxxWG-CTERM-specific)
VRRFVIGFCAILLALFTLELTPAGQGLVKPWTALVARTSTVAIAAFDRDARSTGNVVYSDRTHFAVSIEPGCNGVEAMLVLAAAMLAFPAPWSSRLLGLLAGSLAIQALNVLRIASLFYLGQHSLALFEWAHLYVWQALIMLDVLLVWLVWIRWQDRARVPSPHP